MSDENMTVIFGVLSIIPTLILMFELWYVYVKHLRKRFARADALLKAVVDTRGRMSFDEIMRSESHNYQGGVDDNVLLDLLVLRYKDIPLATIEAKNPQSGTYRPGADYEINSRHRTLAEIDASETGKVRTRKAADQQKYARYNALAKLVREREEAELAATA
jgi:hypothetical protein